MPRALIKQEHPTSSPYGRFTGSQPSVGEANTNTSTHSNSNHSTKEFDKPKLRAKPNPRPWTGLERQLLIDFVVANGAPGGINGWNGVVPGRSGEQSRSAWR